MYYKPGSLKASLCTLGKRLLYDYPSRKNISHKRIGKWVVATSEPQNEELLHIFETAKQNGVENIRVEPGKYLQQHFPEIRVTLGLVSDSTGIIDVHALVRAVLLDFEQAGGLWR